MAVDQHVGGETPPVAAGLHRNGCVHLSRQSLLLSGALNLVLWGECLEADDTLSSLRCARHMRSMWRTEAPDLQPTEKSH